MKPSIQNKLEVLAERYEELKALLSDSEVIRDQSRFRALSKEYAELEPLILEFQVFQEVQQAFVFVTEMLKDKDVEIRNLAQEELKQIKLRVETLEDNLCR